MKSIQPPRRFRVRTSPQVNLNSAKALFIALLLVAAMLFQTLPLGRTAILVAAPVRQTEPRADKTADNAPQQPLQPNGAPAAPIITATKVDGYPVHPSGKANPGDTINYTVTITNTGDAAATGVTFTDNVDTNTSLVNGSVSTQPLAFNDNFSALGNVQIDVPVASGLIVNDRDPDVGNGTSSGLTITAIGADNSSPFSHTTGNGGIVEATGTDGSFKYNPPAGFEGADTFTYTVTDAQGKTDTATAQITMTDVVWFVNNTAGACTSNCDGRLTNPLTSLTTLAANSGADPDESFDVIFVHTGTASYTSGIALETNQRLVGQGVSLDTELAAFSITVPTHSIARPGAGTNPTIANGGAGGGITLATDNTIKGLTINGTVAAAIGIQDGNGSVGNLVIDNASLTGTGKAVDIDQGGTLAVDFDQLSSAGSASEGIHLQGVGGTFTAATGTIQTSTGTGVLIGAAAGGTASSGGAVNFTYGGDISSPGGSVVEIQDRTGGTVTFSGAITEGSIGAGLTGILIDGSAGTINFNGQTFLSAGAGTGNGVTLTNNSGTINFAATGTGLDITTTSGSGLTFTGGGTLNITGAANSVVTSTGQIMNLSGTMGTSGIAFQTLTSGTVAAGNAININNLDAAGAGTFSGGAVTIGGTGGASTDGINITASNSTFSFASATIDNTAGDGIEINGTTPNLTGAVTFTTVNLDGMGGVGVNIVGATNAVNINGGTIGATNDPAGDGVNVNGGTGAVTVAAAVTKTTLGNEVVDISTHNTGAISFTVAIAANSGGGGIRIVDNTGGTIGFSGDVTLNTGTLNALTFTNTAGTGATVSFTEGSIDIDTTSGTGINATNSTIGAGSLTISGASNTVAASTGRAINVDGVTLTATLLSVGVSGGGTTTGVFLKNTGSGGQFIVTGTGSTAGTGGTIQNIGGNDMGSAGAAQTEGTGVYLENVANVSLSNMIIGANAGTMNNFGIRGESVNNFTLTDSEFRGDFGTSTALDEGTIRFGNAVDGLSTGLTGIALFQGNNIGVVAVGNDGSIEAGLAIYVYGANTLNLTIKDTPGGDQAVFGHNNLSSGTDDFYLESGGTSNVTITIDGVAFTGSRGDLAQISSTGDTTQTITVKNNQFHNTQVTTLDGGGSLNITGSLTGGDVTYLVENNSFKGSRSSNFFSLFNGDFGAVKGVVLTNTFGTNGGGYQSDQASYSSLNGGAIFAGIDSKFAGTGTLTYAIRIEGNTIRDFNGLSGITLRSSTQDGGGIGRVEATIKNNTVSEIGGTAAYGFLAQVGGASLTTDFGKMGLDISNNTFNVSTGASGGDAVFIQQVSGNAQIYLPGYAGPPNPFTELSTYLENAPRSNILMEGPTQSGTGGAYTNGTITGGAFVLAVPAMAAPQEALGWQELAVSPVTAPSRDPEPEAGSDIPGDSAGGDMSAGGKTRTGAGTPATRPASTVLTQADLSAMVEAAIKRWIDAGATAAQVAAMRAVKFGIVDLAGIYVGSSTHGVINIDSDGAGHGWFVDATSGEDSEYDGSGTSRTADAGGAAVGKLDLLTVLMHELGHQIGLDDDYMKVNADDVMFGYMHVGERRLPAEGQTINAPGTLSGTNYLSLNEETSNKTTTASPALNSNRAHHAQFKRSKSMKASVADNPLAPNGTGGTVNVNIGTLNPGDSVTITFQTTIDSPYTGGPNVSNQGTISGSNFSNVLTDDPAVGGANDPTLTPIDLTLTWTGNVSTDWNVAGNWSPAAVPTSINDVVIPSTAVANEPNIIDPDVTVLSLDLQTSRTLTIASGRTLTVGTGLTTLAGQLAGGPFTLNLAGLTVNNAAGITMNGSATVSGVLTLTTGNVTNTGHVLTIGSTGSIVRPAGSPGHIIGSLKKTAVATEFIFTVGTSVGYTPVDITAASGGGDLTIETVDAAQPTLEANNPGKSLTEYWKLTEGGTVTASMVFHYLQSDVPTPADEANYRIIRVSGTTPTSLPQTCPSTSCVDPATDQFTVSGVSSFSDWTVGVVLAPTASGGTATGRIVDSGGAPVEGAVVRLSGEQNRKFITDANGVYRFEGVATNGFYNVTPSRANYTFSPAVISFSQIGETTEAAFGAIATGSNVNPLDTPEYFVRQNYLDFLGREPDEAGFNFWSDQILACGGDTDCVDRKRTHVSAAYFLSIEFQETGGLVDGLYRASYGVRPNFAEFKADAASVAPALVVGRAGWEEALENGKVAFADAFVQRAAFRTAFDGMSNETYVDALIANTGVSFTGAERNALVSGLNGGMTRAAVLRAIVEDADVVAAKRNQAFVMMEYFGYLRREPDAAGYQFWLDKLTQFNGNFEQAEMVRAFIVSIEYRDRFPR